MPVPPSDIREQYAMLNDIINAISTAFMYSHEEHRQMLDYLRQHGDLEPEFKPAFDKIAEALTLAHQVLDGAEVV